MNCQELTDSITNIKAQISELDDFVIKRDPKEAINIKNDIIKQFNGELIEYLAPFYRDPTSENYDKEVNRIINKIGDRDPSKVVLSRRQLIFIYDTDDKAKFSNFNQESVAKIKEIREKRKLEQKEDVSIIFNLPHFQIAWAEDIINPNTPEEDIDFILKERITPNTKLYVGPLFPGIFDIPNLEHIYTSFPEGIILRGDLIIGDKDPETLKSELEEKNIKISGYAQGMLDNMFQRKEFKNRQKNPEQIKTIRLKVSDLGFAKQVSLVHIYERAEELGLKLCPAEVGPLQRLKDTEQPMNNWYWVAMDPIGTGFYDPADSIFSFSHNSDGFWLRRDKYDPRSNLYESDTEFLFCLRSSTSA